MNRVPIFKFLMILVGLLGLVALYIYAYTYYQKVVILPRALPEKTIALTFDDGPVPETWAVLALLKELHIPATFFVLGNEAEKHPEILRAIHSGGHELGNHSYDHPAYMGLRTRSYVEAQIQKTNQIVAEATGQKMQLFRAPYGESSFYTDILTRKFGMAPVLWTMSPRDWHKKTTAKILDTRLNTVRKSEIILLHDRVYGHPEYLEVLKRQIMRLQQEGFRFVSLSELKLK